MDPQSFIKKYSVISSNFIDDFYAVFDTKNGGDTPFLIDLDLTSKWIGTRKDQLKLTLIVKINSN